MNIRENSLENASKLEFYYDGDTLFISVGEDFWLCIEQHLFTTLRVQGFLYLIIANCN